MRSLHALRLVEMTEGEECLVEMTPIGSVMSSGVETSLHALRLVKTTGGYLSCRAESRHLVPLMPRPVAGLTTKNSDRGPLKSRKSMLRDYFYQE